MALDYLAHDSQPEAGAVFFAGSDEGLEDPGPYIGRYAAAVVGHLQLPPLFGLPRCDGQPAAACHGILCVSGDVDQDPAHPIRVHAHRPAVLQVIYHLYLSRGEILFQEESHGFDPLPKLYLAKLQVDLAAGVVQKLLSHAQEPVHVFQNHVGEHLTFFGVNVRVGQQLGETSDHGHGLLQVVDYRGGHPSDHR